MKPLLTAAILAVATLVLGATLVRTCYAPSISPSFNIPSTDRGLVFPTFTSIQLGKPETPCSLGPGIHQTNSPSLNTVQKDRGSVFSKPTPIYLDKQPTPHSLPPGVYQTYPWTIILVVPGAETDIRYFAVKPDTNSIMPVIKPHVEVIPKSQTKP